METPMSNNTPQNLPNTPVTKAIPLENSTELKTSFTFKTDTVMNNDCSCSLGKCAQQNLAIIIALSGINLLLIVIILLCTKRNRNHDSRLSKHKDVEVYKRKSSSSEQTCTEINREQSTKTKDPLQRPPLPTPVTSIRRTQTESKYSTMNNSMYLEVISDEHRSYSITDKESMRRLGSSRAVDSSPSPRHRPSAPQDRLSVGSISPYAELRFQGDKPSGKSLEKSMSYQGLNSLTRIR